MSLPLPRLSLNFILHLPSQSILHNPSSISAKHQSFSFPLWNSTCNAELTRTRVFAALEEKVEPTLLSIGAVSVKEEFQLALFKNKKKESLFANREARRQPLTTKLTIKEVLAAAATDPASCHHDSVVSLAFVKLSQRFLISSSRTGATMVWK